MESNMNKKSWALSEEDIATLSSLIEKKKALANLLKILDDDKDVVLKTKAKQEYEKTVSEYNAWWNNVSMLYNCRGTALKVNFDTGELTVEE